MRVRSVFAGYWKNSLDGILMTSPDGRIFSANPAMCTLLNRTEEEIIHLGRQGIVDTNDPHLPILIEEREKTGKAKGELRMIRKDGLMVPVEVSTSLFVDKFWRSANEYDRPRYHHPQAGGKGITVQ